MRDLSAMPSLKRGLNEVAISVRDEEKARATVTQALDAMRSSGSLHLSDFLIVDAEAKELLQFFYAQPSWIAAPTPLFQGVVR